MLTSGRGHPTRELVSVVVTTKNSARTLGACLRSICDQSYKPIELIVVDNDSSDDTAAVAHAYAEKVLRGGPERSAQRNAGIRAAHGTYICIIDSDMVLQKDVIERSLATISPQCEAVAIPEKSFGSGFWSRCKITERECYFDDATTAAARFFTRRLLDEVGLYDETLTGGEDWDLSIRAAKGHRLVFAPTLILHDEGRQGLLTLCRKKFYYGPSMRGFAKKHGNEALRRMQPLRPSLLRGAGRIFQNPLIGLGCVFMKTCEFVAILSGMLINREPGPDSVYKGQGR